jgi:predicted O-methyltransferase YrrM
MKKKAPIKYMRKNQTQLTGLKDMIEFIGDLISLKNSTMVEIGTCMGESAAIFSEHFKKVITCDPWVEEFMKGYGDTNEIWKELSDTLEKRKNIAFYNVPSAILASQIPDASLDFVYIDGWHRVIPASFDIATWLPKLKPGKSFIGGHDYRTLDYSEVIPAVRYLLGEPDEIFADSSWIYMIPDLRFKKGRKT